MKCELAFTAFNRLGYFEETIRSWNNVRKLDEWSVYFNIEPSMYQTKIVEVANELDTTVVANINVNRLGVLVNPWQALEDRFQAGADFVLLAEDDIIVSEDALEYASWTAETYVNTPEILAINFFSQEGGTDPDHVIRRQEFSPLVWGTWRDRWDTYLRDSWDKDYSSGNSDGSEAGWDWNINRILKTENKYVIRPTKSRSDHIGQFNGTHMTAELFDSSRGINFTEKVRRCNYTEL